MAGLEFTRRYAMAHRLIADPSSKCATPHGHNELVTVRLAPRERFRFSRVNMLSTFEAAKGRWHAWIDGAVDHALQLNRDDPLITWFKDHEPNRIARIMTFPGDPTTEALAACFYLKLTAFLVADSAPFTVAEVRVEETPTNAVRLGPESFDPQDCGIPGDSWPTRPDMTINDFSSLIA